MKLSVVICTYNRDRYLPDALESMVKQDAGRNDFELIVVNNNCTDRTEEICRRFLNDHPEINFRHVVEPTQGLSSARNKGIEVAITPLVAFLDDDAIAREDYVKNLLHHFEKNPGFDAVGGKVIPIYPDDKEPEWMSKYIQRLVSKVDDGEEIMEFRNKYPVGCNMAFRKKVFDKVGGFNTDLTLRSDDKYIFSKLKKAGLRTLYAPDVYVRHNIEAYRLEHEFIKNLSRLNGHTERVRLQNDGFLPNITKALDYFIKLGASFIIAMVFMLKGQSPKGRYLVMVMWLSMRGFYYYKEEKKW